MSESSFQTPAELKAELEKEEAETTEVSESEVEEEVISETASKEVQETISDSEKDNVGEEKEPVKESWMDSGEEEDGDEHNL